MSEGGNPLATLFGFWMMVQLVSTLALILGGLYVLYCMGRYASSLDRLAAAVEDLTARRNNESAAPANGPPAATIATPPVAPPISAPPISAPSAPNNPERADEQPR